MIRLLDVAFEAVDGEVHPGQADGGGVLLQAAEGQPLGGVAAVLLHGAGALHEHAAGAAGRVEHRAVLGVQHVGDQRDQGDGGEEFAAVMGLLVREPGQEVLVDAAEDVAGDPLQRVGVEGAQELAEDVVVQLPVLVLGQGAAQALVVRLDGLHRLDDRLRAILAAGQGDQAVEAGPGTQQHGALPGEILRGWARAACRRGWAGRR